jgi:hypothetical protein
MTVPYFFDDYVVIGRQVRTNYDTYVDLLCLKTNRDLIVVELKNPS